MTPTSALKNLLFGSKVLMVVYVSVLFDLIRTNSNVLLRLHSAINLDLNTHTHTQVANSLWEYGHMNDNSSFSLNCSGSTMPTMCVPVYVRKIF